MSSEKNRPLYDQLTLDVIKTLEKRHGICDIKLQDKTPVDKLAVNSWEQKFSCLMPDDIKNFYMTSNGLLLTWSVKMSDVKIPVGHMQINPIEKIYRLGGSSSEKDQTSPSLLDIEEEDDEDDSNDSPLPRFDHRSRIFELDPCEGNGKVCYVFRNTKPGIPAQKAEVWFLDRSLQWHFLAPSFMDYFRLMLTHLGLPQWQYIFTDIGLCPQSKQWFNMYGPVRLLLDNHILELPQSDSDSAPVNVLDVNRVLKGKGDKKKAQPSQAPRKKQMVPSARSSGRMPMPGTNQQYKMTR